MLGSLLIGHALRLMPVGETISILYLFPIIVMILAIPLMGEQVSAINWGFAVLGFAGVLMVARPGGGLDTLGIAFALLTAILAAIFHLMIPKKGRITGIDRTGGVFDSVQLMLSGWDSLK